MKKVFLLIFIFAFAVLSCENPFVTAFLPEIENADDAGNAGNTDNTGGARNVTGISVKAQPALLSYTHGGTLDLSGLVVTIAYSDETSGDVALGSFESFGITTAPADGASLSRVSHNGNPVTVILDGELSGVTDSLAVAKADPGYTAPSGLIANYGDTLADVILPSGWEWDSPSDSAGNTGIRQHDATFTPADAVNYNLVNIQLAVTVTNITGITVKTQPELAYTHGGTLDLSGLVVTAAFSDTPDQDIAFADFAVFGITAVPADGSTLSHTLHDGEPVTVKRGELSDTTDNLAVAKAEPDYTAPSGLTAYEGNTLADVTLPNGWAWDNPTASVGNTGIRQHYATFTPDDPANFNAVNIQLAVAVKGPQTVNISFPQITGEPLIWAGGEEGANRTITILRGNVLTLELDEPEQYGSIDWLLNPEEGGSISGGRGHIFIFTPPERFDYTESEVFTLTLMVEKDDAPYNRTVRIQVTEE
jgi:hypothetical protein